MTKVFDSVFHGPKNEDKHTSQLLADKINTYYWIEERHLDLDINFSLSLEVVQAELLRINGFRAPRDKLVTLQNVMKLVVDLITKRTGKQGDACSDCILPTLILAIIRSNPQDIISNVKYITRFRNASDLEQGNNQFCMTSMVNVTKIDGSHYFYIQYDYQIFDVISRRTKAMVNKCNRPFENQNLNATRDEFKHFTEQVTGFFGQLITDVKTTANEVISSVQQPPGSGKDVFSAISPFAPNISPSSATPMEKHPNLKVVDEENEKTREDYELELAIAISLSEAQEGKFDIESYSPMHTKMDEQTP